MELVLKTNNLGKKYKNFKALNNVNMHIKKGAIYGLIGKNGAGKTTLIRVICGLNNPSRGSYTIYGEDSPKGILKARKRMGAIIEAPTLITSMSAKDNLIREFIDVGRPSLEGLDELLDLVKLKDTGNKKVANFSLGMKERLGIALALVNNPDFLILDEPINGLDPEGIVDIRELILKLNKEKGITVLISSHYLDELSKIATDYGFLDNGEIIKEISSTELKKKMEHKIELNVNDVLEYVKYFELKKINYEVTSDDTIIVYGSTLAKLTKDLYENNLTPNKIKEQEETLESYYINLIGGLNHE